MESRAPATLGTVSGLALSMVLLLVACPGPNPLDPGSFTDQFRHDLRFSLGAATEPESTVNADDTDIVMFQVRAAVNSPAEPVRIDSIAFQATGTGDDWADVASVSLYQDRNLDGLLDPGDILLDQPRHYAADNGRVRFVNLNMVIDHDKSRTLILVCDLAGTAADGETFSVRLADEDDVDSEGEDSGCPVTVEGLPVVCPDRTVGDATVTGSLLVSLGASTPVSRDVGPTATRVEMVQIALETSTVQDISIDSITFHGSGTADEVTDIGAVYLFRDVNDSGALDLGVDVLVSVSAYTADDGTVTFPGIDEVVTPGQVGHLLLVYDLAGSAWTGETFQAGIPAANDLVAFGVESGLEIEVVGPPVIGEVVTIKFGE